MNLFTFQFMAKKQLHKNLTHHTNPTPHEGVQPAMAKNHPTKSTRERLVKKISLQQLNIDMEISWKYPWHWPKSPGFPQVFCFSHGFPQLISHSPSSQQRTPNSPRGSDHSVATGIVGSVGRAAITAPKRPRRHLKLDLSSQPWRKTMENLDGLGFDVGS